MSIRKSLRRNQSLWIVALLLVAGIKIFSLSPERVEVFYTSNFYFFISEILRFLFGWIPFSLGDILYLIAGCWLLWKLVKNIKLLFKGALKGRQLFQKCAGSILGVIFIYIIFNIFWGLNYNREGIANQLQLPPVYFDTSDILQLQNFLLEKVNSSKLAWIRKEGSYPDRNEIFKRARKCYKEAEKIYPFLQLNFPSIKRSLYGWWGNYLGFTGYYNPFTGEAQANTTVPKFLLPYIATHEIAHQIGYAKENEANFVGFLAAVNAADTLFYYSTYLDLFMYTNREVYYSDSVYAKQSLGLLLPQ